VKALRTSTQVNFPDEIEETSAGASREVISSSLSESSVFGIPWTEDVSVIEWVRWGWMKCLGTVERIDALLAEARSCQVDKGEDEGDVALVGAPVGMFSRLSRYDISKERLRGSGVEKETVRDLCFEERSMIRKLHVICK
jgi:hypothetical protein